MGECAQLRSYINSELSAEPRLPEAVQDLIFGPSSLFVCVLDERVPTFLELLESTPSLFANLSQAIEDASGRLPGPGFDELEALAADFVAIARNSCGIFLNQEQITDVTRLFDDALTLFLVIRRDCGLLNQTIVEQAIAAADFNADPFSLPEQLRLEANGLLLFQANRTAFNIESVLLPPTNDIPEAAQTALSEFLFIINDFCGIPSLSDTTLAQLNVYFLEDLVNLETSNNNG